MKRTIIIVAAVLIALLATGYGAIRWQLYRQWGRAGAPRLFQAMNKDFEGRKLPAEMLAGGTLGDERTGENGLWIRIAVTAPEAERLNGAGYVIDLAPGRHEYLVKAYFRRDPNNLRHLRPVGPYEITRVTP